MKKHFIFLLGVTLSITIYSQNTFDKGYIINNNNQQINCLIKMIDWNNNPSEIKYKLTEDSQLKKATIKSIKEFGITNVSKFIRAKVLIDRSSKNISKLGKDRKPKFNEEELFLKVLIEGKAILYQYIDYDLTRFFYKTEQSNIDQLVYKSYKTEKNKIAYNNRYKQQLLKELNCANFKVSKYKSIDYEKNDLMNFFIEYNKCYNVELTYKEPKQKRDFFNLSIRPRINNSTLSLKNAIFNDSDVIEFDAKTSFGIGLEAEIILPINKEKWALVIEPTYQSFKAETRNDDISVILGGEFISKVNYTSIEIPVSIRHYLFLNKTSKFFVDFSYVFDFASSSTLETTRSLEKVTLKDNLKSDENLAFGLGYKLHDKYIIELKYQLTRNILENVYPWSSDYKTFSIIFGYSLF